MHILSLVTENKPSWINGRRKMTVEIISWSISTRVCDQARIELEPLDLQSDSLPTALRGLVQLGHAILEQTHMVKVTFKGCTPPQSSQSHHCSRTQNKERSDKTLRTSIAPNNSCTCRFKSLHFCRRLITFANTLDPDQDWQSVSPNLDPNCLNPDGIPERIFWRSWFDHKKAWIGKCY